MWDLETVGKSQPGVLVSQKVWKMYMMRDTQPFDRELFSCYSVCPPAEAETSYVQTGQRVLDTSRTLTFQRRMMLLHVQENGHLACRCELPVENTLQETLHPSYLPERVVRRSTKRYKQAKL